MFQAPNVTIWDLRLRPGPPTDDANYLGCLLCGTRNDMSSLAGYEFVNDVFSISGRLAAYVDPEDLVQFTDIETAKAYILAVVRVTGEYKK
jgi:hypothetical protein